MAFTRTIYQRLVMACGMSLSLLLVASLYIKQMAFGTPVVKADPYCGRTGNQCTFNVSPPDTYPYTGVCIKEDYDCGCSSGDQLGLSTDCGAAC
jgi:hypothetical protein